jgi:LacI family transcriptional regulator
MPSASVRDVAALAGVSVGTVSNVLNRPDRVSQDSIARVRAAIEKLGFVRNDAARQLRAGRSKAIGMVILDVRNPFFTDVARGAEDEAAQTGYSVILGNSDENAGREGAYLDLFEEQRVRGVLLSPYGDVAERLRRLRSRGIPVVLVDRPSSDSAFSSVSVDDISGGMMAAEHLVERGRTRIAFVGGPLDIRQVSDRLEGARRAIARGGPGERSWNRRRPFGRSGHRGATRVPMAGRRFRGERSPGHRTPPGAFRLRYCRRTRADRAHRLRRHRICAGSDDLALVDSPAQ